jgi:uncharacterized protein (TIGR00290 family)
MKKKISISWSGGKDSAFALYKILLNREYDVVSLHTVFNAETKRVGMHGVQEAMIEKQAESLGIELEKLYLHSSEDHASYKSLMEAYYAKCRSQGILHIAFGDIFLEDLRKFRDDMLKDLGLSGVYPLWRVDSKSLIYEFLGLNFKTLVCAANANFFPAAGMGRTIDHEFIATLPVTIDPCGENGEFHTFVYDGPIFKWPIGVRQTEVVDKMYEFKTIDNNNDIHEEKIRFWFCELSL